MNISAPAVKLALCLTAAAGLHLSLFAAVAPGASTPQVRGGVTRVLLGTQAASLGREETPADQPTEDDSPQEPEPEAAAEPEPPPPEPSPPRPEPVLSPEPQPAPKKEPAPQKPAPETAPPAPEKPAADAKPSPAASPERKGQAQTDTTAGEQEQPDTEPAPRETGKAASKPSEDTQAPTATADTPGNAASSNYKGLVMAHISRIPRPRASSPGSAHVSFTVSSSGAVEQIGISKSSGSSRFDREAMKLVRQAAPFPSPPAGVNRTFEIKIEGR